MNYEVQQTRWDRIIRRASGSIGPGSRVRETIAEVFPMIDLERVPGELLILGGTNICSGAAQALGAPAQIGVVQLFNPPDSGNIITVTRVTFSPTGATMIRFALATSPLALNAATERFRDTRRPPTDLPVGNIRSESIASQLLETHSVRVPASTSNHIEDPNGVAVLTPGSGITVGPTTTALTTLVAFLWRERPAEESELSL